MSLTTTNLDGNLPLLAQGKVRDIYTVSDSLLLFVATDRISAYDVIMNNGIPAKGKILTQLSIFWFNLLAPYTKHHLYHGVTTNEELFSHLPKELSNEKYKTQLEDRTLLVQKFKLIPLEVIVRGYITGSAWKEYKKSGTVHGIKVKEGLHESEEFDTPIYTPSTKADQGEHDENISPEKAAEIVGKDLAAKIEQLAIKLYVVARDYAKSKGIIIADTKFEFGLDEEGNIVLVDEVLTPDSSRFWRADSYKLGQSQNSYDKQFMRDWLTSEGLAGKNGVSLPEEIISKTKAKYVEAYETLTDKKWSE